MMIINLIIAMNSNSNNDYNIINKNISNNNDNGDNNNNDNNNTKSKW